MIRFEQVMNDKSVWIAARCVESISADAWHFNAKDAPTPCVSLTTSCGHFLVKGTVLEVVELVRGVPGGAAEYRGEEDHTRSREILPKPLVRGFNNG